jgi:hypothetical protein
MTIQGFFSDLGRFERLRSEAKDLGTFLCKRCVPASLKKWEDDGTVRLCENMLKLGFCHSERGEQCVILSAAKNLDFKPFQDPFALLRVTVFTQSTVPLLRGVTDHLLD